MCHHRGYAEWEAIRERRRERRGDELDDEVDAESPDERRSDGPTTPTPPADD